MTDPITTYTRALGTGQGTSGSRAAQRQDGPREALSGQARPPEPSPAPSAPRLQQGEQLDLSETARRSMADPTFDRAKVDAIKAALREGTYPLDSRKIAENFVALERLVDD